jgi:hypothetical protein
VVADVVDLPSGKERIASLKRSTRKPGAIS